VKNAKSVQNVVLLLVLSMWLVTLSRKLCCKMSLDAIHEYMLHNNREFVTKPP